MDPQNANDAEPMLRWFRFEHLPEKLHFVSRRYAEIAAFVASNLPLSAERTVALRKLLESKDAAIRAAL